MKPKLLNPKGVTQLDGRLKAMQLRITHLLKNLGYAEEAPHPKLRKGFEGLGLQGLGFKGLGFGGLGFNFLEFRASGGLRL